VADPHLLGIFRVPRWVPSSRYCNTGHGAGVVYVPVFAFLGALLAKCFWYGGGKLLHGTQCRTFKYWLVVAVAFLF